MRLALLAFFALATFSAIAAEPPPSFSAPVPKPPADAKHPRVLLVGGGSSHNFAKFFGESDKAILAGSVGWLDYTENANGVPAVMPDLDLLVWSANQSVTAETAKALMDWVGAGKPLVLLHPGVWYNWNNFPEWNKVIVGGGSRGHDHPAEFGEKVVDPTHQITQGVPATFKITDEQYHMDVDPAGTPIEVLVETDPSPTTHKVYPSVWVVKHPKARIVCIAPGHDERAHDNEAFKTLLKNSVLWALGK